ncbi:MAG: anti-sigma factor antagonist [Eubacteriales bacterium]
MEEFQIIEDHLCVKMPREIDHHQVGYFSKNIDYYIFHRGINNIVFDFEHTELMDSSGIGMIVGRYKKVACFHGKLYAINTNKQILKILHMVSLQKIIEIIKDDIKFV